MSAEIVKRLRDAGCVFAEDEARLLIESAATEKKLESTVRRRIRGEPLEVILGWVEFCGLRVAVEPGVFVPRKRTEFLARQAIAVAAPGVLVVDLCCGTGALGLAVATAVPDIELHAADIDPAAVRCARRNIANNVYEGDLYAPLPAALHNKIDVLVVNAPYVPTEAIALMPPEARDHEPKVALDGGADGLDVQRRVIAEAHEWLAPGGRLLIETGRRQAPHTAQVFATHGLTAQVLNDMEFAATVVLGRR